MKRSLSNTILLLAFTFASINAGPGQEPTWPLSALPPGANPAATATPRQDWLGRVQSTLEQTRGKHFDLVFDGDSITDNWRGPGKDVWAERYTPLNAVDFGIGGDKTEHLLWRLQHGQVDGINPKLVVLMIGSNNTGRDTADQIAEGIKAIVAEYRKRCPDAHILLLGILPRSPLPTDPVRARIIDTNKKIPSLDDGKHVTYLDFGPQLLQPDGTISQDMMPDFVHPSAKGYRIWADTIQPIVDRYCPKSK